MYSTTDRLVVFLRLAVLVVCVIAFSPRSLPAQVGTSDVGGLEITPDGSTRIVAPNTSGHEIEFNARNGLITSGTWSFSCSRSGNVTCGTVEPTSATIPSGGFRVVSVIFNAQAGGTGRITLTASPGGETGYVNVDVAEPGPPTVTLQNHNRDNVDRSLCLTSGAGDGAAWSCGDLVISHAMPGYTTMNRQRSLTLIHNSGTANPRPAVAAVVSQAGRTLMDTVWAELWLGSPLTKVDSAGYTGWSTGTGSSRQVVLDFNADAVPTGAYPIEFRVRNRYNGVGNYSALPVRDTLLIVNRSASEFGAGFGIAGLEQLYLNQPVGTGLLHLLWVGGDGSAKLYRQVNSTTWQAAEGGFRETITLIGGVYTRTLRHGVQVQFDAQGRHTNTINRTGQTTAFGWTSTTSGPRLTSITVPPTGQGGSYALSYATAAPRSLVTIQDPAARTLTTAIVNGRLNTVTDPDGLQTTFGWDASRRITSRKNREGWTTRYEYSKGLPRGSRVTKVTFPIGPTSDTQTAFTVFEPWNDKGLAIGVTAQVAEILTNVFTRVVGPRVGVTDNATFWIDRWGAPTKIQNPAAAITTLVRGNDSFPALITRIIHPNGRITDQTYNTRGNLTQVRDDIAPVVGDPLTRVTEYKYTDLRSKVIDSPTEVWEMVGATARKTIFIYNSEGQPTEIKDPRGHRASYVYKTTAALKGLLIRSTELNVETWEETTPTPVQDSTFQWRDHERRFDYDVKGNLQADTSAIGAVTSYKRDPKGRVTDVYDPLKTRTQRVYDGLNRVTALNQYTVAVAHPIVTNPLAPCQGNQAVCADNNRNWDSPPNPVNTTYAHGPMHLETVLDHRLVPRSYDYDTRGLVIGETDDFGRTRTAFYNEAGLIDSSVSRTGREVRFYYDAAGRRTAMAYDAVVSATGDVIPKDSIRYGYDVMDNLVTVTNREGTITRSYTRNGLVKQKTMDFVGNTPNDVVTYNYDETGALRTIVRGPDLVRYNYAAATGDLTTTDVILGAPANMTKTFTFEYDSLGRRRTITYPIGGGTPYKPMTVKFRYDKAGVLRRLITNHPGGLSSNILTFSYRNVAVDPIGRVIRDSLTCQYTTAHGSACQNAANIRVANDYSRLGALLRQVHRRGSATEVDTMGYDTSGNMKRRKQYDLALTFDHTHAFTLDATGGDPHNRLASFVRSELNNSIKEVQHNFDGARSLEFRSPPVPTAPEERFYHYDGLGRMTGTAENIMVGGTPQWSNRPNACQYDGDGQMIGPCENGSYFLTLDGHNASGTIENGSSSWRFFHGLGVDDPLVGYFRGTVNKLYYWVTDGNGREFAVADSFGRRQSADDAVSHMGDWRYAGGTKGSNSFDADRFASPQAPKLSFFRNRAYDQETGRWTQEDPIGIAAGLNLYQFNGNNPVLYTDPFGLCPACKKQRELVERTSGTTDAGLFDPIALAAGSIAAGGRAVAGRLLSQGTAGGETVLFEGGKDALKQALGSGIEGVNSGQAGAIGQALKEGSADAIKVVTGENGLVTYSTRAGRNGHQTLVRIYDEAGGLRGMAQAAWDAAGKFVHGEVWK